MLKIKKIKLSGFRGIPIAKELDLTEGSTEPRSFVLYGPNSSGKTSFVDGIEWFLDKDSKIQWLQRSEAKEKAYPHQAAKEGESFVEIEFRNPKDSIGKLIKHYEEKAKTKPTESDKEKFTELYGMFVIPPYLRYMEIIDFVYKKSSYEKYQQLSSWMGFGDELVFQEKLSVDIPRELKEYESQLIQTVKTYEDQLKRLIGKDVVIDATTFDFCNEILAKYNIPECRNLHELTDRIVELNKQKSASSGGTILEKLTRAETSLGIFLPQPDLPKSIVELVGKVNEFKKETERVKQIDIIELYTKALDILTKQTAEKTKCPVCGTEWDKEKLTEHITGELELLKKVKEDKEEIARCTSSLRLAINREVAAAKSIVDIYKEIAAIISGLIYDTAKHYLEILNNISENLDHVLTDAEVKLMIDKEDLVKISEERDAIVGQIKAHKAKIQQSDAELKLIEDINTLNQIKAGWQSFNEAKGEQEFTSQRIQDFYKVKDEVVRAIQKNVKDRFDTVSSSISKYFSILRKDKDVKDIKLELNEEKGKAAGRSAEIELSYYGISVKPAYKVLSESLLNSLGLAVYFTCVKQFNTECNFIVLDDIMNSLDMDKRDTLLDLVRDELSDYQIILFTHDEHWFEKIGKRFPSWIRKKIISWDYVTGPNIESATTTKEEIEEYLKNNDETKAKIAGQLLSGYVEDSLNELCEGLWAEVRHRYERNTLPTMEDLFVALHKRLKSTLKTNPVVEKVAEAKKFAPILRNFVSHSRTTSISLEEVRRVAEEWFSLEDEFWCSECNQFVEYHKSKDAFECQCGQKKFEVSDSI